MDKSTTVSLYISGATVILTVPLSVAANLLTPKLKDWWAQTSERRRVRRVAELRQRLAYLTEFGAEQAMEVAAVVGRQLLAIAMSAALLSAGGGEIVVCSGQVTRALGNWTGDRITAILLGCMMILLVLAQLSFVRGGKRIRELSPNKRRREAEAVSKRLAELGE